MLLNLRNLFNKYKLNVTGVIQVGAHWAEEYQEYVEFGIKRMFFIEPCKEAFEKMNERFLKEDNPGIILGKFACGDTNGKMVMYTEHTNQGQSNSLLKPKVHLNQHPDVIFNDTEEVDVVRLDDVKIDLSRYNFLNMDCQGFEDRVLRGATETLKHIDYIYTEVNRAEMYDKNAMIEDLDAMLPDFKRVETGWASDYHGWGDAFFVRASKLEPIGY